MTTLIVVLVVTHVVFFAAGWFFGWKQGHRGLPVVSDRPRF